MSLFLIVSCVGVAQAIFGKVIVTVTAEEEKDVAGAVVMGVRDGVNQARNHGDNSQHRSPLGVSSDDGNVINVSDRGSGGWLVGWPLSAKVAFWSHHNEPSKLMYETRYNKKHKFTSKLETKLNKAGVKASSSHS
jgi:hypothetical protein